MKINSKILQVFIEQIAVLNIILFTYAAVSKILDFQNFQIQIGQSPLLSAFATPISYGVPAVEFIIISLLLLSKTRIVGLYGSFMLMVMFTAYIYIILNYSSFLPCSCGGILEKMSWTQHLVFNSVFVILNAFAIIASSQKKTVYFILIINLISSICAVVVLFVLSEDIIEHRNNFVRRLPEQFNKTHDTDLKFNSYYFAGSGKGKIFLGNSTSPLLLTEIDTTLKTKKEIVVKISNYNLPFRSLQIKIEGNYFYVHDGTVPCLFRGKTDLWTARQIPLKEDFFSNAVFTDSVTMAFRTRKKNGESILATLQFNKSKTQKVNASLLQKQIDGIFDVDGNLLYDRATNKLIYLYFYRNQFIVTDQQLNLITRGKTIDTVSKANIKIAYNSDRHEKKLAAPPLMVNKNAYFYKGLLFVHSALMGKYEDSKMWKQASLIDVYDTADNSYIVSFYIYNIKGQKLRRFMVQDDKFFAVVGSHLVTYSLNQMVMSRYSKKIKT